MELLTINEAALMLKVNPVTVRRYIADGRLSAVRAGKGVRVPKEYLEKFIEPVETKGRPQGSLVRRARPTTASDPLWNIVGIGRSEGPTDVSERKHAYLANAYVEKTG